ncbi:hypothetical protein JCM10213_008656 [Rhodosporidiobolus nylandii]
MLISRCPNVEEIRLLADKSKDSGGFSRFAPPEEEERTLPVMEVIQRKAPRIRRLVARNVHHTAREAFASGILPLSSLKHLSFTIDLGATPDPDTDFFADGHTFQLESHAALPIIEPYVIHSFFSETSYSTLTSLTIALQRERIASKPFSSLSSLTIEFARPTIVLKSLKTLPSPSTLRSLELRQSDALMGYEAYYDRMNMFDGSYYDDSDEEQRQAARDARRAKEGKKDALDVFLPQLPPDIEYLHLAFYLDPLQRHVFVRALDNPLVLPSLKMLDVADESLYEPDIFEEPIEGLELEILQAFRKDVKATCEKRGWTLGCKTDHWADADRGEGAIPRSL